MNHRVANPFDSIESAQEFVALLEKTVVEAKRDIEADVQRELNGDFPRRLEALRITLYSLEKLQLHLSRSRRILNDLRSLRRLLFDERTAHSPAAQARPKSRGQQKGERLVNTVPPSASDRGVK